MTHAFVSYVHDNRQLVHRLCRDLEKHGVTIWLDRERIHPGQRWQNAIRKAIIDGGFFLACFSDEYAVRNSTYMNEELVLAIEQLRKFTSDKTWFIPIRLSDCRIPERIIGGRESLHDIQWVDMFEDWDLGIRKILSVLNPSRVSDTTTVAELFASNEVALIGIDTSGNRFYRRNVSHDFVILKWDLGNHTFRYIGNEYIQLLDIDTTM